MKSIRSDSPRSRPKFLRSMPRMVLRRKGLPVPAAPRLSGSLESCAVRHPAVIAAAAVLRRHPARGLRLPGRRLADTEHRDRHGRDHLELPGRSRLPPQGRPEEGQRHLRELRLRGLSHARRRGLHRHRRAESRPARSPTTAPSPHSVTNGGGAMPAFKSSLSPKQIADVSAYVVDSTGGTVAPSTSPPRFRRTSRPSRSISTGR